MTIVLSHMVETFVLKSISFKALESRGNRPSSSRCASSTAPVIRTRTSAASSNSSFKTSSWRCRAWSAPWRCCRSPTRTRSRAFGWRWGCVFEYLIYLPPWVLWITECDESTWNIGFSSLLCQTKELCVGKSNENRVYPPRDIASKADSTKLKQIKKSEYVER